MKKFLCLISILFTFTLYIAPAACAESDSFESYLTELLDSGVTMTDIVEFFESDPAVIEALSLIGTNELSLYQALYGRELQRRTFQHEDVIVSAGTYTIGDDIPAGVYTLTAIDAGVLTISTYSSDGESLEFFMLYSIYGSEHMDQVGKLELRDGETISISGTVSFSTYKGLGF